MNMNGENFFQTIIFFGAMMFTLLAIYNGAESLVTIKQIKTHDRVNVLIGVVLWTVLYYLSL